MGSGDEAHAATSRFGQGSQRNEYLRQAERRFIAGDSIGRDLISGDQVIYNLAAQVTRPSLLSRRLLIDPVINAFVAPPEFSDLQPKFAKERVIILRGSAGCGKQAVGARLLYDLCSGTLYQLSKVSDISSLQQWLDPGMAEDHLYEGAGFLLAQPRDFADLISTALQGLDEALTRRDARLVITVDADVPLPDHDLSSYVAEIGDVQDYRQILVSHLKFRLDDRRCAELLTRDDLRDVIAEQLGTEPSSKKAADMAEAIADWAQGTENDDDLDVTKIRFGHPPRRPAEFERWFSGLGGTAARSFAIALAVLDGSSYEAVAKAARALNNRFERPPYLVTAGQGNLDELDPPFSSSRTQWLAQLQAGVKTVAVQGSYGRSYADIVKYKDSGFSALVIRRAWSDYQAQPKLLTWLGELAQDAASQVRINAGLALGQLAVRSFDHFASSTLVPWAKSKRTYQREAVAYALRVAAANPALRDAALSLIAGWYTDRESPTAQATAARAYGLAYGPVDANDTFEKLHQLAGVDDVRVAIAIGDSISDLLISRGEDFARPALARLAASLADRERNGAVQLIFLIAADTLVLPVKREEAAGGEVSWPYLLWLTAKVAEVREPIISLWRYVLHDALFHTEAGQVIGSWAKAAENEPQIRGIFLRLARAVAVGDERARAALLRHAASWSSADNLSPLPIVAAAVQKILGAGGEI